jgi:hypothetical protein
MARRLRWVVPTVVGVVLLLWLVLLAPQLLVPARSDASLHDVADPAKRHELEDGRPKLQNDVRTTLLQALGGAVIALGAFFTYRQLQVNREGQITERFTRAIDQLGNDKGQLDVTLGGLYALKRIAKDSPADRATIAEVLTAYVRGHAPGHLLGPGSTSRMPRLVCSHPWRSGVPTCRAVMTVLARTPTGDRGVLDLHGTDLRRANLAAVHLKRASFGTAHLERAFLSTAHLETVDLINAHLEGALLFGPDPGENGPLARLPEGSNGGQEDEMAGWPRLGGCRRPDGSRRRVCSGRVERIIPVTWCFGRGTFIGLDRQD